MPMFFPAYQHLVTSTEQLLYCQQATSVAELLALLKQLWCVDTLTDGQLLAELQLCNQECLLMDIATMAGLWMPYRYDHKTRLVSWCLRDGSATEPFHDQFVSRCRQQVLLNQLIVPKTAFTPEASFHPESNSGLEGVAPAGFIFHLSRCGSTLLSGSFAEIGQTAVLSESALLTEFLLDTSLTDTGKKMGLPLLVKLQSGAVEADVQHTIIKWNAWDIFQWALIRSLYPHTPVVLIIRDPVEILASHQRSSGRHMSGDPSLAGLHPVFDQSLSKSPDSGLLDFRIGILAALQAAMLTISSEPNVRVIDYTQLNAENIQGISEYFGVVPQTDEIARIHQRMQHHSKEPERQFTPDSLHKQQVFSADEQHKIRTALMLGYTQLRSRCLN